MANNDIVARIIAYENGDMTEDEVQEFFKDLVRSGVVYHLQGHYQREAVRRGLIPGWDSRARRATEDLENG